ncbi:hypothetical protein DFH09DRAFT_1222458 [Mycena vulgaris]|nr:hypothetical protein DFH09DRAFT_1222458 [Mycena vulgaris]
MASPQLPPTEHSSLLASPREIFVTSAYWVVYFCLRHDSCWPLLRARFIPCLLISIVVLPVLFISRPLAWFNAVFLVLGEAAAIIALLFEAFLVDHTLVNIFDAVLIHQGLSELTGADPVKQLGPPTKSAQYSPFSLRLSLEFILFLPLTFIPLGGGPLYCLVLGRRAGPFQHWRYFKLVGLNEKQRNAFIKKRQWKYTWFGMVALLLQLIPVFSMLKKKAREQEGGPTIPVEV